MKVLLVATVQSHICQFHRPLAEMLHSHGAQVHVAARNNLAEKNGLKLDFADRVFDVPFSRSPASKDNITAYRQLKKLLAEGRYDIVHCNTPMGGIVARLAAKKARKNGTQVFYTAHGFHFYQGAPRKNWLVFYPIEKWFAKHYTDKLITITKEDHALASAKFRTQVCHMHGVGANSQKYHPAPAGEKQRLRAAYGYAPDAPILLCVGELNRNKNQATVIRVMAEICRTHPDCKLLLAGNGPAEQDLRDLVQSLHLQDNVEFLGYTLELDKYLCMADIAVSLSFREGLPFNIMEAMLCGVPVVASNNRGHRELIEHGRTGLIVPATDTAEIAENVLSLLENTSLPQQLSHRALAGIQPFTDTAIQAELQAIYELPQGSRIEGRL